METVDKLTSFFSAIKNDGRISITHIAVYAALLQYWKSNGCMNPILAFSHQIMDIAKISAPMTYRKCVKELSEYGYIQYIPSFKRNKASQIFLNIAVCE